MGQVEQAQRAAARISASRLAAIVDRRFNRARYDLVDLGAVQADLADAVHRALEPAHVWI